MFRRLLLTALVLTVLVPTLAFAADPRVRIETSKGTIVLELYPEKAPQTVANFLEYVRTGHYFGTTFHRVIPGFMIQGGHFQSDFQMPPTRPAILNEAANKLKNLRGTIAMARTGDPNSATDQFFINLKHNDFLDYRNDTADGIGYCVFGKVVEGMDVVDAIAKVPTGSGGPFPKDVPRPPVVIKGATLLEAK
ncbi:MAG: peptidyl-prolyl cis-trans isomerase [Acidobacteria bacterium]|nr:peptidyl-prolyl cis-trans isomerase [Acidobacteriota bacterium]